MVTGGARRGTTARRRLATTAALGLATLTGLAIPDGRAAAETTVDLTVGVNGYCEPNDHAVVRVSVTADELIDGDVTVTREGRPLVVRRTVQVPAGTTKEVLLVVPGPFFEPVRVEVRDGDRVVATEQLRPRHDATVELVGVLPRLAARGNALPEQVTMTSRTGRVELSLLPPDVLDLGPVALEAYDTLVGSGDDLTSLDGVQRQSLLLWVASGGRLLLDDDAGTDALPREWRPGPAGYAWAGRGEVRLSAGAGAAGRWADIVEPSGTISERLDVGSEMIANAQQELAARAGIRLPSLTPVIIALAVYGLVIGPVVYLLLRRARRLTLGWVVVPAVAIVTALVIVVAGGRFRAAGDPATATFVETSPAGAVALTNALTFDRSGGSTEIATPPGWHVDELTAMWGGDLGASRRTFTADDDGSGLLALGLEAGQVVTNAFSGPLDDEALTLTATATGDGRIIGTVSNDTDLPLRDTAVFVGNDAVAVGDLAPGASADWAADAPESIEQFASRADRVWATGPAATQLAELGIWGAASLEFELFPTGMARAVAWTDRLPGPVLAGEGTSTRTALSTLAPVDPDGRPPEPSTVRAIVVRSPFGPFGDGQGNDQVYRYLIAPGTAPSPLGVDGVDRNTFAAVAFWDGERWVDADIAGDGPIAVPPEAVRGGAVLMKAQIDGRMGDPMVVPTLEATGG